MWHLSSHWVFVYTHVHCMWHLSSHIVFVYTHVHCMGHLSNFTFIINSYSSALQCPLPVVTTNKFKLPSIMQSWQFTPRAVSEVLSLLDGCVSVPAIQCRHFLWNTFGNGSILNLQLLWVLTNFVLAFIYNCKLLQQMWRIRYGPEGVCKLLNFGCDFDAKMTFSKHLCSVSRAASQMRDILRKSWRVFHDESLLLRCFCGFCSACFEYYYVAWLF